MRTKIYTKTGDLGQTSLIGGQRVSKADPRLEAYGTLDELNSHLGLSLSQLHPLKNDFSSLFKTLTRIQNDLFIMGSHLACEKDEMRVHLPLLQEDFCDILEKQIDQMTDELPELNNFILPGGQLVASQLHISRAICRRAERQTCSLPNNKIHAEITKQLNRLSDFLFVAARFVNLKLATPEVKWAKPGDK